MSDNNFPTTDNYKLEVNVNLSSPLLREAFNTAMRGETPSLDKMEAVVASLVGREGVSVEYDDYSGAVPHRDFMYIGTKENVALIMGVTPDNLPPNVPEE